MSTPFDNISFSSGQSVSQDDILRLLTSTNPQRLPTEAFNVDAAIQRVNDNESAENIVAYKDAKGQAVLTNTARPLQKREAEGDRQVPALLRPIGTDKTGRIIEKTETPIGLIDIVEKLRTTEDKAVGEALYSNFQRSYTEELTRVRQEAFTFAENKLGIPTLVQKVQEARQLDAKDPLYFIGAGDSPVTKAIIAELVQARQFADNEAKNFLSQNRSMISLETAKASADAEYNKLINLSERRSESQRQETARSKERTLQRQEAREEKEEAEVEAYFSGLDKVQLERIDMLHAADMAGLEGNEEAKKKKIVAIIKQRKSDKNYLSAISAPNPETLASLAFTGNGVAKELLIAEEASRTKKSKEEVAWMLTQYERDLFDKDLVKKVLKTRPNTDPDKKNPGDLNLRVSAADLDPDKKLQATQQRVVLLQEYMSAEKTKRFMEDVSSWGSIDPVFLAAVDRTKVSKREPTIENVLTNYIDGKTGPEAVARINEFKKILLNAGLEGSKSALGKPNWMRAQMLVDQEANRQMGIGGKPWNQWAPDLDKMQKNLSDIAPAVATPANFFARVAEVGVGKMMKEEK